MNRERFFFAAGAILACLGVGAGAFGAHALKNTLAPDRMIQYELAVRYQMYHALALIAASHASVRWPSGAAHAAGYFFIAGTLLFCGTVYALAFGSPRWLGAITPLGGVSLIAGWALLAYAALRRVTG